MGLWHSYVNSRGKNSATCLVFSTCILHCLAKTSLPSLALPAMRKTFQELSFFYLYIKLGSPEINERRGFYIHHLSPFPTWYGLEVAAVVRLEDERFCALCMNLISVHGFIIFAAFFLLQK